MQRNVTVGSNFPLKKGDVLKVREPNGVLVRYTITSSVPADRKREQTFQAEIAFDVYTRRRAR